MSQLFQPLTLRQLKLPRTRLVPQLCLPGRTGHEGVALRGHLPYKSGAAGE